MSVQCSGIIKDASFERCLIGRFGKSFGLSGWIKVISFTTHALDIVEFKPWLILKNNQWEEFCFEDSKEQANSIIVKPPGCNSPEEASRLTNIKISIWRKQLPKLKDGEYYWSDIIGLTVINKEKVILGIIQNIIATGSNDVLVVTGKSKHLIPYISSVILKVDLISKNMHIDWPEDFFVKLRL